MFVKAVPNNRGKKGTYYCSLVEAYRENGKIKHRTIRSFGLLTEENNAWFDLAAAGTDGNRFAFDVRPDFFDVEHFAALEALRVAPRAVDTAQFLGRNTAFECVNVL